MGCRRAHEKGCGCSGRRRRILQCAQCEAVSIDFHNIGLDQEDWWPYEIGMVCTCPAAIAAGVQVVDDDPPVTFMPKAIYECAGSCGLGWGEEDMFWSGGETEGGQTRWKWAWRCAECIKLYGIRKGRCLAESQITI